jgi:hypothetical protein
MNSNTMGVYAALGTAQQYVPGSLTARYQPAVIALRM